MMSQKEPEKRSLKHTNYSTKSEQKLPHIYTITPDLKYVKEDKIHFMYFDNAKAEYAKLKKSSNVYNLMLRNA